MTDSRDGLFLIRDEGFKSSTEHETEKQTGVTEQNAEQKKKYAEQKKKYARQKWTLTNDVLHLPQLVTISHSLFKWYFDTVTFFFLNSAMISFLYIQGRVAQWCRV